MKYIILFFLLLGTLMSSNNLKNETSPYLLQHKDNPVNWYPWGEEALSKAKKEDKFIFLSIGYSTCHWCHVMAHESFEDEEVAKILNRHFISIKLDKEQYPHIDGYYQNIYRLMNKKGGGWPLTIVLTSDMKVFFSGTYIPKDGGYGSAGLLNILNQIITIPKDKLVNSANSIMEMVELAKTKQIKNIEKLDNKIEDKVIKQYKSYFDFNYKGFSKAPKFPQATNIQLLLKLYEITKNKDAINMATSMLNAMAKGGIYDQIEGGFYRYSVDQRWEVPHFEKMLYTNAELLQAYILAYKITNNKLYKDIINQTISQIDKRFQQNGVYQSASNADSKNFDGHNEEGFYFIYEYDEVEEYLENKNISKNDIKKNLAYFGITKDGNIDGDFSNPRVTSDKIPNNFQKVKEFLIKLRGNKEYPFIDNKINTAWNSLYIKAKFQAGLINKKYIDEAKYSLDKLLDLVYKNEVLYHQTIKGIEATQEGLLEDYSFMASALFEAYQTTLDEKYFKLFENIVKQSIHRFYKNNIWIESSDGFKTNASINDSSYASALAINIQNLILYSTVKADTKIYDIARKTIDQFSSKLNSYPAYYPSTILAVLQTKYEPVFIKSVKNNLKTFDTNNIKYPFVYKYIYDSKQYLACKINSCFSYDKDFNKVKKDIEEL